MPSWYSHNLALGGNIVYDGRPAADNCPVTDLYIWLDGAADTQKDSLPNLYITPQVYTGGQMREVSDRAVVVYRSAGIHDDVAPELRSGLNNAVGKDDGSVSQGDSGVDPGSGMNGSYPFELDLFGKTETILVPTDSNDSASVAEVLAFAKWANHGRAKDRGIPPLSFVFKECADRFSGR